MPPTWTMYVTAQTLHKDLAASVARRAAATWLRQRGFRAVVLENYRGGCVVSEDSLKRARDDFQSEGFVTLGGLMPVHGEGFGVRAEGNELRLPTFCYSREETRAALEEVIVQAVRVFGTVVIDDAFMTACRCDCCDAARKGRPWDVFRRDLLVETARHWIAAAHQERSDARVVVKFPQYYDRYHLFGYDAERFPSIFDAVWQGTETRDPATLAYGYVEPYEAYVNIKWMQQCAGEKLEGAWFDSLDCDEQLFFEQAVTTSLGALPRITVFSYSEPFVTGSILGRIAASHAVLEKLHQLAAEPSGVHVVKPPNRDGGEDLFLFDYLGMLGIPCVPATHLETTMRSAIVTAHAVSLPNFSEMVRNALLAGRQVIATFDALRRMDVSLQGMFGYEPKGIMPGTTRVERFETAGSSYLVAAPCYVSGDLAPTDASVLIWAGTTGCEAGMIRIPFVTARTLSTGGRAVVWNLGTFGNDRFPIVERLNVPMPVPLLNVPKEICDALRAVATAPLGFAIKAPARVATYLFRRHAVFVNYSPVPAEIEVKGIPWKCETLLADSSNTGCTADRLLMAPRSFACVERVVPH